MTMLETNTEHEFLAADGRLFDSDEYFIGPKDELSEIALHQINPQLMGMIACRDQLCDEIADRKNKIYDIDSTLKSLSQNVAWQIEQVLALGEHKIGKSTYQIILDPNGYKPDSKWLVRKSDDGLVSFREPRGLSGDEDKITAQRKDVVLLLVDLCQFAEE